MTWRVLIIEDEPELQMVLRDNLKLEGYSVLSAAVRSESSSP